MLIGINGKARSGKDTFATMLAIEFQKQAYVNFVAMAYADELKNDLMKNFGLTRDQLYGDSKEISDERFRKTTDKDEVVYWTPREIMQEYGQWCRKIEPNHWVRRLYEIIDSKILSNVIVTDIRQRNEVDALINRGGYHIRITRKNADEITTPDHETETALDAEDYPIDFYIENNGTLKDLEVAAKGTVEAIMIMEGTKGGI